MNKKIIFFLIFLSLVLEPSFSAAALNPACFTLPPYTLVYCEVKEVINWASGVFKNILDRTALGIFAMLANLVVEVSRLPLTLAVTLLQWILGEGIVPWSYTNPNDNPVIALGWTFARDLVNALFVLLFALMGLFTALGIKEYDVRKMFLPALITIVLINFTPVICGLIVDACNILINFFLVGIGGFEEMEARCALRYDELVNKMGGGKTTAENIIATIVYTIVSAVLNFFAAFIILVFFAIFMVRYAAIWLLVILSPLAFFSRILPPIQGFPLDKSFYNRWWGWFLQWCFIGIPAMFFLYLANHFLLLAPEAIGKTISSSVASEEYNFLSYLLAFFFPYFFPFSFLYMGAMLSVQSGAIGAKAVIEGGQKLQAGVKSELERRITKPVADKMAQRGLNFSERIENAARRISEAGAQRGAIMRRLTGFAGGALTETAATIRRQSQATVEERKARIEKRSQDFIRETGGDAAILDQRLNVPGRPEWERQALVLALARAKGGMDRLLERADSDALLPAVFELDSNLLGAFIATAPQRFKDFFGKNPQLMQKYFNTANLDEAIRKALRSVKPENLEDLAKQLSVLQAQNPTTFTQFTQQAFLSLNEANLGTLLALADRAVYDAALKMFSDPIFVDNLQQQRATLVANIATSATPFARQFFNPETPEGLDVVNILRQRLGMPPLTPGAPQQAAGGPQQQAAGGAQQQAAGGPQQQAAGGAQQQAAGGPQQQAAGGAQQQAAGGPQQQAAGGAQQQAAGGAQQQAGAAPGP
jgi:hypothetical protein